MKHYVKSLSKILVSVFLLVLTSACSQIKTDNNPYTGFYVSENDPTYRFIILEKQGKLYEQNAWWGGAELTINDDNSYIIENWKVTGDFLNEKKGSFQQIVLQVEGQEYTFNRVQQQDSSAFLYGKESSFTNFSHPNTQRCDDQYALSTLTENSKHPEKIEKLIKQIKSDRYAWGKQDSLLIFKDNKLLVEEYFNGWTRNDPHQVQAVSKSITSLLLGSVITEGKLADVNAPIVNYLPQYAHLLTGEKSEITLANFLNMSAGLEWDEWSVPYTDPTNVRYAEMQSDDSVAFTLKRNLTNKPGNHFSYSGGYVSVVGGVIDTATKQPTVADYVQTSALAALCFKNSFWSTQNDGKSNTAGGVLMRPLDMLKIGQLMLDEGEWQGKQIINKKWVSDSMDPATNPYNNSYGYFWWHKNYTVGEKTYAAVLATGWAGQQIVIVKDLNLVVVTTASILSGGDHLPFMMRGFILPAFVE